MKQYDESIAMLFSRDERIVLDALTQHGASYPAALSFLQDWLREKHATWCGKDLAQCGHVLFALPTPAPGREGVGTGK